MIIGVDISKYNLGWNPDKAVKPISFVIQRASWASYKDSGIIERSIELTPATVRAVRGNDQAQRRRSVMAIISLTQGEFALVDDGDFDALSGKIFIITKNGYVRTGRKYLHRIIMSAGKGVIIDHINGNKLDNRKCNLRICTKSQNGMNRPKQVNNTSGYKGVTWDKTNNKWTAQIMVNQKSIKIGRFSNIIDAAKAYNHVSELINHEFSKPNSL